MKRLAKIKKKYLFAILIVAVAVVYLVFAYNYFYFRWHSNKLPWPNNSHTYTFNERAKDRLTYVALGDSLTFGFGAQDYKDSYTYQLARYFSKNNQRVLLKDFSFPGYKSIDVLETVDPAIAYKPDIITVFVGVNDTHKLVQSADFGKNYDQILSKLTKQTDAKIYVINLPYLGAGSILWPPYNYYFDQKTKSRNQALTALAKKYKVNYLDLYSPTVEKFKNTGPWYSKDLYHPSAEGYKMWAGIIEDAISN